MMVGQIFQDRVRDLHRSPPDIVQVMPARGARPRSVGRAAQRAVFHAAAVMATVIVGLMLGAVTVAGGFVIFEMWSN